MSLLLLGHVARFWLGSALVLGSLTAAVVLLVHEHRTVGLTRADQEADR